MARSCNAPDCIAVVPIDGDGLCPVHREMCARCGHLRPMHPVVQFQEDGPRLICGAFTSFPRSEVKPNA